MNEKCGRAGHQGLVTMCHACEVECRKERDAIRTENAKLRAKLDERWAEVNDLILERERLRIKCNELVDKRDEIILQLSEARDIIQELMEWVGAGADRSYIGPLEIQTVEQKGLDFLSRTEKR